MTTPGAGDSRDPTPNQLFSSLYPDLRKLAHSRLRRNDNATLLDTTALVHESYLRFLKNGRIRIEDRAHFLSYAARVMRSVIVDFARERATKRRGGTLLRMPVDTELVLAAPAGDVEI